MRCTLRTDGGTLTDDQRALLRFTLPYLVFCALVFLFSSRFFVAWEGQVVSVMPARSAEPSVYTVLVVNTDGEGRQVEWAAEAVQGLGLPVDPLAIPPDPIPESAPRTKKSRFQLYYLVQRPQGDTASFVPFRTATSQTVGLAVIVFLVGLGLRNMLVSGSPLRIERRPLQLPRAQAPAGAARRSSTSRKGPPPPRKRRGRRR